MDILRRSPADHSRDNTSSYYRRAKKISVLHLDVCLSFTLEFRPLRVSTRSGKSGNLLEDQEKFQKFD